MKRYQFKRVWALTLMTAFCVSAWGDGTVTIMRYLQSKADFEQSVANGDIEIREGFSYEAERNTSTGAYVVSTTPRNNKVTSSNYCYWDDTKDALRFTGAGKDKNGTDVGGSYSGNNRMYPNGIYLKSTPASETTPATGPFSQVNTSTGFTLSMEAIIVKDNSGSIARFFDATKYWGEPRIAGNRQYCFLFKPRDNIELASWTVTGENSNDLSDWYTSKIGSYTTSENEEWKSYMIMVTGSEVHFYVNGIKIPNEDLKWHVYNIDGTERNKHNPTSDLLGAINTFDLTIGNGPSWDQERQLEGWVRNVQIVSSTSLKNVSLAGADATTKKWEKTLFGNSVNISSKPLIVANSIVALTPHEGYYVNWDQIDLNGASWINSSNKGTFTMPSDNVTVTVPYTSDGASSNAILMKRFRVHYDSNANQDETVNNMPDDSDWSNYWTSYAEVPSYTTIQLSPNQTNVPTRTGYTFVGWDTKAEGNGTRFTHRQTDVTAAQLGVAGNVKDNTINLYAIWQKVDYTLTKTYETKDYNGSTISNPSGIGLRLDRARESNPSYYVQNVSDAQINDRVQVVNVNSNADYFLDGITYYADGISATAVANNNYFVMPAKATTVKAVYRKYQEFNFTTVGTGSGGTLVYEVNHRNAGFTEKTNAMQTDVVRPKITVASGYVLRSVTYTYDGVSTPISLYEGKGTGTIETATFTMPASAVTVTATILQDRTLSVTSTNKGTIKLANAYGSGSENDNSNGSLTAHSGDGITVTATPATGYHFNTNNSSLSLLPLTPTVTGATGDETQKTKMKAVLSFTMPDADVAVGSVFTENTYNIVYHPNGGESVPDAQVKSHFESLPLSPDPAVWSGHTFLGWSRTTDGAVAYAPGATAGLELNATSTDPAVSPDGYTVTLYAVWKATEFTVSVDPGINGGAVSVDKATAQKDAPVKVNYTAYEGYSEPHLYYYMAGEAKTAHAISGTTFTMPEGNVTVYATFNGSHTVSKDIAVTTIANGAISVGGVTMEGTNSATIGAVVNVVAKPATGYRLDKLYYQKVADASLMKVRNRASAVEVDVDGKHELTFDGTNVTYNNQAGEYVGVISGVSTDLYVSGTFKTKDDLSTTTVTIEGLGNQSWTGSAIVPDPSTYIVKFGGEVQTDYSIEWSNNVNDGDMATAVVTAGPNCERYTGSQTLTNVFKVVKELANAADYSTNFSSDFTYDGDPKTLTDLEVYKKVGEDKTKLTLNTNYTVSYQNNTNAGTATAVITISGEGGGDLIRTFNIKPKAITITAADQTVAYGDGIATTIDKAGAETLVGSDALSAVTFAQTTTTVGEHAGAITVSDAKILNGTNDVTSNYTITYVPGKLTITAKELTITAKDRILEYGDAVPGDMTAATWYTVEGLAYGETLTAGPTGYSVKKASDNSAVTLAQGTAADTYKLSFTGATASANYTISYAEGTLTITQFDLSNATVDVTGAIQPYDGTAKTATTVAVKKGTWALPAADYTITYGGAASQTTSGTYAITATAASANVTGSATSNDPLVIGKADLAGDMVTATIADQIYTGSQIRPTFTTLKLNGVDIAATEYDVISYGTNINVGTGAGQVTIRAKESSATFAGTKTVPFNILAADLSARTASVTYGDAVVATNTTDTHRMTIAGTAVTTPFNDQALSLASSSVKVRLTDGSNDLTPDDYEIWFKKGTADAVSTIPANALGTYQLVIKGKANATTSTTNTTESYLTGLTLNVTLTTTWSNLEWVTYYDERFNLQTPTGYQAYYVTGIDGNAIEATSISYIPKNVPVLLEKTTSAPAVTGDVRTMDLVEDVTNTFSGTAYAYFVGVPSTGVMPAATPNYILMNGYFVKSEEGAVIGAHRCYLTTPPSSPARQFYVIDPNATGINAFDATVTGDDRWYDLQGNRISKPTRKGLYIRNGKKVVVK